MPEGQGYAETPQNSYDGADVIGNCQYNTGSCATSGAMGDRHSGQ